MAEEHTHRDFHSVGRGFGFQLRHGFLNDADVFMGIVDAFQVDVFLQVRIVELDRAKVKELFDGALVAGDGLDVLERIHVLFAVDDTL